MKKLLLQAFKFFGLSGIGWLLDFSVYTILGHFSDNLVLNNYISSWVGVTFVFIFATRKIFKNDSNISIGWKYVIYLLYQAIMIFLMSKLLNVVNGILLSVFTIAIIVRFSAILAKIIVTPISMVVNFIVMKCVIEKI